MRHLFCLAALLVSFHSVLTAQYVEVPDAVLHGDSFVTLVNFPVTETTTGVLHLRRRTSAVDAHTQWLVPTRTGDRFVTAPVLNLFTGEVEGSAGSKVWLVCAPSTRQMICVLEYASGVMYIVGPSAGSDEHVIAASTSIRLNPHAVFTCDASETIQEQLHLQQARKGASELLMLDEKPLLQLDVAVETDVQFFIATGSSLEKAQAYTAALYSVVSAIYEDEVGVRVHLAWVKTWTDDPADSYDAKGDPFRLRDSALVYWKNNYQHVERDVYQVLTSTSYGSGGFGYYDALCGKNGDYGMSSVSVQGYNPLPTLAFTYDVYITAHELGHNFNANHTHSSSWNPPLDTCRLDEGQNGGCFDVNTEAKPNPGSIMSYCGGINNDNGLGYQVRMTFLPPVADVMRTTAEASLCLSPVPTTSVELEDVQLKQTSIDNNTKEVTMHIEQAGDLHLSLFDVVGKCVAQISKGFRSEGVQSFTFDTEGLNSGVYYLVAVCNNSQATPLRVTVTR